MKYSLIVLNVVCTLLMVLSTFSGTLPPQDYPKLSVLPLLFPFFLLFTLLFLVLWIFVKRKWMMISAVGLILSITDIRGYFPLNLPNNAPQGCLKVMSYNVGKITKEYTSEFISYLEKVNPDILCLQECSKSLYLGEDSTIAQLFPYISSNDVKLSSTMCMSKYPIVGQDFIEYESKNNSSVAYCIEYDKDTILLVNNHLQSYSMNQDEIDEYKKITGRSASISDREKGTKDIVSKIIKGNKIRGPQVDTVCDYIENHSKHYTIVVGDMNEPAMSYSHYKLTKNLNDAFTRSGNGFGFSYSRNKIHYRIDHILCSDNITPYEAEVDKDIDISDHYPIICYLKLQ